jgi:hypothetical protein
MSCGVLIFHVNFNGTRTAYSSRAPVFSQFLVGFALLDLCFSVQYCVVQCLSFSFFSPLYLSVLRVIVFDYPFGVFNPLFQQNHDCRDLLGRREHRSVTEKN